MFVYKACFVRARKRSIAFETQVTIDVYGTANLLECATSSTPATKMTLTSVCKEEL